MPNLARWRAAAIVGGILLGLLALFIALMLGGGGHGWTSPFIVSLGLPLVWPVALWRLTLPDRDRTIDATLLLLALCADAWLGQATLGEADYLGTVWREGASWVLAWLALWFGWQLFAAIALLRRS